MAHFVVLTLLALTGFGGSAAAQENSPPKAPPEKAADAKGRSFVDEFNGIDRQRWFASHGWSNGPHQGCGWSRKNVRIVDGVLELVLSEDPDSEFRFACGELQSRAFYGYGTYEVRMQAAAAPGTVSAFFNYTGSPHGKPHDEIDFEVLGKDTKRVQLNYYVGGSGKHETFPDLGFDSSTRMADYAFQWLPDTLRWYIDGKLVREEKASSDRPIPEHSTKLYISLWNGSGPNMEMWLKPFVYPGQPLIARYERLAFTAAGEACQFPTSIVCTPDFATGGPKR